MLIFTIALAVRLTWIFLTGSHLHPETWEYEIIANNLLKGDGFVYPFLGTIYHAFEAPLYPIFCAVVYFFTNHSYLALEIIQAVISSLTCVIVFKIADRMFGKRAGILSALIAALHPGLIVYTAKLHPLFMDAFLISLVVFLFMKLRAEISLKNQIFTGIAAGLCILTRPTIGLFLLLALAWIFYKKRYTEKKVLLKTLLVLCVSLLIVLPWTIRNYAALGRFVFIQNSSDWLFWCGNNQNATGTNYMPDGNMVCRQAPPEFYKRLYSLDETGQAKYLRQENFNFIKTNPLKFGLLFARKLYYFWWFSPQSGMLYPSLYFVIYKIYYAIICFFAIFGIALSLKSREEKIKEGTQLLLLLLFSISFIQSLFYAEGRHRWAVEPLFFIFSAYFFIYIKGRLMQCLKMRI